MPYTSMSQSSGLGHKTVRRASRVGERHHEGTQWRGGWVPGLSLNMVRSNFFNKASSSLIH